MLAGIKEYAAFVTDDVGNLRRYLFDSNVRDFLGFTQVNTDILKTLSDTESPDFWWLNNGVTILATEATVVGKTINLVDIQIVNGLQTTESIYRHFYHGGCATGDRSLMVKIIVSKDVRHRDRIIQATNNQNVVEIAGLRASDKAQRDIEEFLEQYSWFYERRKNYYKNIGKPQDRFVTPMFLASGFVALVMKNPYQAVTLRQKFMRKDKSYETVFSDKHRIELWLAITEILKRVEIALKNLRPLGGGTEGFLSRWRNLVALLIVSKETGRFSFSTTDLIGFDISVVKQSLVEEIWNLISAEMASGYNSRSAKKKSFVASCCSRAANDYEIEDLETVVRRTVPEIQASGKPKKNRQTWFEKKHLRNVTDELIQKIDASLPAQPWKPGIHREIATTLSINPELVSAAIGRLISSGRRNRQKDGVVYGSDGRIIAVDPDRSEAKDSIAVQKIEPI